MFLLEFSFGKDSDANIVIIAILVHFEEKSFCSFGGGLLSLFLVPYSFSVKGGSL